MRFHNKLTIFVVVVVVLEAQLLTAQGKFTLLVRNYYNECIYILTIVICLDNSLTFSPSTPLCVGDVVQMICYVVPPTAQQFDSSAALIAFNNSTPSNLNGININDVTGVDTSRYTASVSGLTISSSRPGIRLTISPYQASDGATNFSCHGLYVAGIPSYSLISGYPQELAGLLCFVYVESILLSVLDPPSSSVVTLSQPNSNNCSSTLISWSTPSSDRSVTSYSVYRDGVSVYNGPDNQYTDNTQLNINTVYKYSVVAISCAGNSIPGVNTVSIGGEITCLLYCCCLRIHFLGFSLTNNPPIFPSYDNTSSILIIDWVNNNNIEYLYTNIVTSILFRLSFLSLLHNLSSLSTLLTCITIILSRTLQLSYTATPLHSNRYLQTLITLYA